MTKKAEEIVANAEQYSTTYERVKYVHDYLVEHVTYDYECAEKNYQTVKEASNEQSHTAYGALVKGLAVCDGYARSFQMLMNMLGIECEYIEGYTGGLHAWNYIKLDGENYWMDVTWDDLGFAEYPEAVKYDYFCCTSEELYNTHSPKEVFEIPECTATEYSFFHRENCYLDNYNFNEFCEAIQDQKGEQLVSVRLSSKEEFQKAKTDLFRDGGRYFKIPYFGKFPCHYIANEDTLVIGMLFD